MTTYKHTQIGYLMLSVTLAVLAFFAWAYSTALAEPASVDSGPNFAVWITESNPKLKNEVVKSIEKFITTYLINF
ncbi:MAG: hypothetical protein HYV53_01460 [Parcubacteria group bacterium]|nr:hypothetical protein [Parcubacteria group bacterium]